MLPAEYKNENDETDSIRLDEQQTNNQSKGIKDYLSQKSDPIDADTQMDLISEDSEKSHDPLFTKQEFIETVFYLNYNLSWMFTVAAASGVVYMLLTFEQVFGENTMNSKIEIFITVLATGIILVDIVVVCIHSMFPKISQKQDVAPYNIGLIILDLMSIFTFFHLLIPLDAVAAQILLLILCLLRLYRVIRYFYVISRTADMNNVSTLLKKYALLIILLTHSFACIWQYIGCYDCSKLNWTIHVNNVTYIRNFTSTVWYTICLYYTSGIIATVGFGDIHGFTIMERSVSMIMMITGYGFLTATFLGGWTAVQMEHYRRHAQFTNKFSLLKRFLIQRRVPKHLGKKLCKFYLAYWHNRCAIANSQLFTDLPLCFKQQVHVDTYWFFFQQSFYLRNVSDAFKRALAAVMRTEIKIDGEIIYEQGKEKDIVVYIVNGSVSLHSAEDNESTILTFGMGSLLGESCLIYGTLSPTRVTAASFSVLHVLRKKDFWKVASQYVKLHPTEGIHAFFNRKLEHAMHDCEAKKVITGRRSSFKTLKIVRDMLHIEKPRSGDGYFHIKSIDDTNETNYSDLYILSRQETEMNKYSDDIFARTIWPWSLHAQSPLLELWEYIVMVTVMVVAILYPYRLIFGSFPSSGITIPGILINCVYILDVIIQTLTCIETGNVIISDVSEIFKLRLRSVQYILDIVTALPLVYIVRLLRMTEDAHTISILSSNRLLKIQRIFICMNKMGNNFKMNIPLVRVVKYIVILIFVVYFMGSVFYSLACYRGECSSNSWWQALEDENVEKSVRSNYPFAVSMYFAMLVVSQAGFGDITAVNTLEMTALIIFFAIGVLVFSYLVADFSATLMLTYREKSNFIETVHIIRSFLVSNNMLPSIQCRINEYLLSQWMYNNGYNIMRKKYLLHEAPHCLLSSIKHSMYTPLLLKVPLFQKISGNVLKEIANECKTIFLPPNEMVVYGGEVTREIFIIEKGYCLQVNAASSEFEKILGPHSHFSVIEMLSKQRGLFNVRTLTHVQLTKISYTDFKRVLASYPELLDQIDGIISSLMTELTVERLFMRRSSVTYPEIPEKIQQSWFIFPKQKLHLRNFDYERGFHRAGAYTFFKIILLRRTIIPHGNFMLYWEIGRALCAFLTGMAYPLSVLINIQIPNYIYYIKILDLFALADIYIRLHVGYYNRRGLLVTHPKFTAIHYLSHAFVIDLIGILPMQEILYVFKRVTKNKPSSVSSFCTAQSYLAYFKLLQMYRLPDAFAYFQRNPFKRISVYKNIMLFVPISLVFINFLASLIIIMTTEIRWNNKNETYYFYIEPNSWCYYQSSRKTIDDVLELYVLAYYWVTSTCLTLGFGDIIAAQPTEMYFVIFSIIAGYLFFTYVLVVISSSIATINRLLTTYQEHMKHIISYMKKEQISSEIQMRTIRHFEHVWQKTHGLTGNFILEKCNMALRKDAVLSLYEQTLLEVPVFVGLGKSFYRLCGIQLHEYYLLKNEFVIKLNDIIDIIYIIHKGEAVVKGPDGSILAVLNRGCIFGNIDNVSTSRSMVSVVVDSHIELLAIKTTAFYQIASEYPYLLQRMKKHVLFENLNYIVKVPKRRMSTMSETNVTLFSTINESHHMSCLLITKAFFYGMPFELLAMMLSFGSLIVVTYHMSFQDHSNVILMITYMFDVSHIIKIFLGFFKPFRNHLDEIVTDKLEIRKRYMAFSRFYVDLFAAVPFELFCLIFVEHKLFYLSIFRMNRIFRYYEVYKFFDLNFNRLNINVSAFKLGALVINFGLILHVGTCILYVIACPAAKCNKNGWIYSSTYGHDKCRGNHYFCSLYFMSCIITWSGIGDLHARTVPDMIVLVFIMVCTKFISANFVGDISAIVQNYSHSLVNYDYGIVKLKGFLKNNNVSAALRTKIVKYSKNLWKRQSGSQIPLFLQEAPISLQEEIKIAAYGKHLYENYVFESCHVDFLRLLITKLQVRTFFADDIICQEGDINNRMYFIHKGIVEVLSIKEETEVLVNELREMDCFGIVQGLYLNIPHNFTFKAATVCIILYLELKHWVLLLRYFPSARFEIYEKVEYIM